MDNFCNKCGEKLKETEKKPTRSFNKEAGSRIMSFKRRCPNKKHWYDSHYSQSWISWDNIKFSN